MGKQILINAAPWETRVAVLDDTTLVELYIERGRDHGIAGNIYKGKVVRVLPGMQASFVDIGLEKAAFLHVSDLATPGEPPESEAAEEPVEDIDAASEGDEATPAPRRRSAPLPPIEERLSKGDELLVQVAKEPMGSKGARVTAHLSLPGRHLVLMPGTRHLGISRRIEDRKSATACVPSWRPTARPTVASSCGRRARARRRATSTTTSTSSPACGRASARRPTPRRRPR